MPSEPPAPKGRVIVDAHHHVWDPTRNYHPWLCDEPPIPFRYGDYSSIRRPYLPADYRADAAPWKIAASVYVETEWDPADPIGEMDYVADSASPAMACRPSPSRRPGSIATMPPRCSSRMRLGHSCAAFATSRAPIRERATVRPAA